MGFLGRVKSLTSVHKVGMVHVSNSSHTTHGTRATSQPTPMKSGQKLAAKVQSPSDSNPHGLHAAQLANARTALASGTPYNPRNKKTVSTAPKVRQPGISVLSKRYKRV